MSTDSHQTDMADDEHDHEEAILAELLNLRRSTNTAQGNTPQCGEAASETEAQLLRIWRDTFGHDVSADDNYFALGGDSMKSIQISARAQSAGFEITMQDIVEHPTVNSLARHISVHPPIARPNDVPAGPDHDPLGLAYPSTAAQEGMLFQCLTAPDDPVYVSQFSFVLIGGLEPARFEEALHLLVRRHPALRVAFPRNMLGSHRQLIHDEAVVDYAFDGLSQPLDDAEFDALARAERERPFDLGRPPLLRVRLVVLADQRHGWIWTQHHLVADGRGQECLIAEFGDLYRRLGEGAAPDIAEDASYRDFLIEAHLARESGRPFWVDYLAHFEAPPPAKAPASEESAELSIELTQAEADALSAALIDAQLTLGSAFAAWFSLALCATFERRDLLVGIVTSGRHGPRARYSDTVGNLISTLPLRATLNRGRTLTQWTRAMQRSIAEIQRHEQTSLQDIKRWIEWPSTSPFFDAIFVHENYGSPDALLDNQTGLHVERAHFRINEGYPLVLVCDSGARKFLTLRYLPDTCSGNVAQALLDRTKRICELWLNDGEHDVLDAANYVA